jgi:L-lactate dehydrogenase complex protein LldE
MALKVQLFVTCLVDGMFPEVGEATTRVLERAGCEVDYDPRQTCCGQPAFNVGLFDEAALLADKFVDEYRSTTGPIVVPSGSCADMIIHHMPDLLDDAQGDVKAVTSRVVELTSFLVDQLGNPDLGASCSVRALYHPSCHGLRNLGLTYQPKALLAQVEGLELADIQGATDCCGFGGLFSIEFSEVAAAILAAKLDQIEAAGPDFVVGGDVSCLLHIEGGLKKRDLPIEVRHISQVMAGE